MTILDKLKQRLPRSWSVADSSVAHAVQSGYADALEVAGADVVTALEQMSVPTAAGQWLDEWGGFFAVPRNLGETDQGYAARMIPEVLRPKCSNTAIAGAIEEAFGQRCEVVDAVEYRGVSVAFNGAISHNGSSTYSDSSLTVYGLFDVEVGFSLASEFDAASFAQAVRGFVGRFRAAGTQLRSVSLGGAEFGSDVAAPQDDAEGVILTLTRHNAVWRFDGAVGYSGLSPTTLFVS